MKKLILAIVALFALTASVSAMSYEAAREQALFLTDKMAYELNLTEDQYEAAYEVNLDYLMSINNYDELYGAYWQQRNLDLSYILLDWQYNLFLNASYFYRPLYWESGCWHFAVYARYPRRTYLFFGRPHFVAVYHGGHSWRVNGGRSWYHGRKFGHHPEGKPRIGMRDGFKRGDYKRDKNWDNGKRHHDGDRRRYDNNRPARQDKYVNNGGTRRPQGIEDNRNKRPDNDQKRSFGNRQSSTRRTVGYSSDDGKRSSGFRTGSFGNGSSNSRPGIFGGNKRGASNGRQPSSTSRSFTPRTSVSPSQSSMRRNNSRTSGSNGKATTRSKSGGGNGHSFGGRK